MIKLARWIAPLTIALIFVLGFSPLSSFAVDSTNKDAVTIQLHFEEGFSAGNAAITVNEVPVVAQVINTLTVEIGIVNDGQENVSIYAYDESTQRAAEASFPRAMLIEGGAVQMLGTVFVPRAAPAAPATEEPEAVAPTEPVNEDEQVVAPQPVQSQPVLEKATGTEQSQTAQTGTASASEQPQTAPVATAQETFATKQTPSSNVYAQPISAGAPTGAAPVKVAVTPLMAINPMDRVGSSTSVFGAAILALMGCLGALSLLRSVF